MTAGASGLGGEQLLADRRGPRIECAGRRFGCGPIKAHQINLQRSLIDRTINRFASVSQLFWFGFAVGTACSHDLAVEVFEAVAPWPHQFGKRMNAFLAERAMEFGIMP
jgi:hypothetical protein